jgi:hypothetical protein
VCRSRGEWLTGHGYDNDFSSFGDFLQRLAARREARMRLLAGVAWKA